MIDSQHIPVAVADEVSKIVVKKRKSENQETAQEVIDFYTSECDEVHIVRCDKCGADLCLEVLIPSEVPQNQLTHHQGRRRIVLGDQLLASRKRLDGAMGYECACGNNTIAAQVELGLLPSVKNPSGALMIPEIEPHHAALVAKAIKRDGYAPDIEELDDNKTRIETFTVERIK